VLDNWYRAITIDSERVAQQVGVGARQLRKADSALAHAIEIATVRHHDADMPRIHDEPPLVYHPSPSDVPRFQESVEGMLADYTSSLIPERRPLLRRYRLADAAYKV